MSADDLPGMWAPSDLSGGAADIEDEFGPYLAEKMRDPEFRIAYLRAIVSPAPIKRNRRPGWRRRRR